ncbi:SET domain-containing protein [Cucurbitaria berberidis CBS 394.84]|uniref:SET domain-containing protein n=1 Tax=Cucurbitaria berberidis CBS 394.84 TaxID=1168544 RepID=A0A9P4L634_9PLEO|nr:SET domain-containing protein [Cucurbitaria berberidis CBS 394.84]KAF1842663.1 SET domain-containing protein [Cucurbitaria berberidis CBS 394.84]
MTALRRSKRERIVKTARLDPYSYGPRPSRLIYHRPHFYSSVKTTESEAVIINNNGSFAAYSRSVTPNVITSLKYEAWKWTGASRPAGFHGPWPPSSATELMNVDIKLENLGTKREQNDFLKKHGDLIKDECLGKYCWQQSNFSSEFYCQREYDGTAICDHTISEWKEGCADWQVRFEVRPVPGFGYGLYSKWKWTKGDILGAYLGEMIPEKPENTDYCHEVKIGPMFGKTKAMVGYVDAEKYGNYARFCNHSCENNAIVTEARVGNERILALRAIKHIAVGEQICIDYGSDYFQGRQCLCGKQGCKYPKAIELAPVTIEAS